MFGKTYRTFMIGFFHICTLGQWSPSKSCHVV